MPAYNNRTKSFSSVACLRAKEMKCQGEEFEMMYRNEDILRGSARKEKNDNLMFVIVIVGG